MSSITPIPFPFYNSLGVNQSEFFENKIHDDDLLSQYITFINEDEKCCSQNCDLEKLKKNIKNSSVSTINKLENDKDEESEKYGGIYTQLYIASLSVVGLFIVYRLLKK